MIRGAIQEGDVMSQEVFMAMQEQDLAGRIPAVLRLRKDLGLEGLVQGLTPS